MLCGKLQYKDVQRTETWRRVRTLERIRGELREREQK